MNVLHFDLPALDMTSHPHQAGCVEPAVNAVRVPAAPMGTIRNSLNVDRTADILTAVKKFGAATIMDIALDLVLHQETIRRRLLALVDAGHLILIEPAAAHSRALYGMPDLDDQAEFDLYRTRSSNWQRGQHGRDYLVAAMFGAPAAEVRP